MSPDAPKRYESHVRPEHDPLVKCTSCGSIKREADTHNENGGPVPCDAKTKDGSICKNADFNPYDPTEEHVARRGVIEASYGDPDKFRI
jgi:hypothetical protein